MGERRTCTWLTDEEYGATREELQLIDEELAGMGATDEFCLGYFRCTGGACERVVSGQCLKHSPSQAPLPPGKMCCEEFGRAATMLRQKIERVEEERLAMRREWDQLKQNRRVCVLALTVIFVVAPLTCPFQPEALEHKLILKNRMHHLFGELQGLRADRLNLLMRNTPVNAESFHTKLEGLLQRKMDLLERLKLGGRR